jgi:hypothetical protein
MLFDESASTFYMTGTSAVHQVIAYRTIPGAAAMPGTASQKRSSSQAMTSNPTRVGKLGDHNLRLQA